MGTKQMEVSVLAYFDPGSGSMLVQLLVGGVAGLLVFARYLCDQFSVGAWLRRRLSGPPSSTTR